MGMVSLCRSGKGVTPLQLGKTSKVRIGRGQFATMFNGKSCQMRVCNQIGDSLPIREHLLKYSPMSFGRTNDSCTRLVQPTLHTSKGLFEGERVLEDPSIGPYPNKCGQNCPAQTNSSSLGELAIPPFTRLLVAWVKRVFRIQENIGIDENQRESSPSIWASNSWMLSILRPDRRRIACGSVL